MDAVNQSSGVERRGHLAVSLGDVITQVDDQLRTSNAATDLRTVSTGWPLLDEVIGGGVHAGDLLMLGGPPGVGKTISALQWARNLAREGNCAVFICYEHEPSTLLLRLLALEAAESGGNREVSRLLSDALDSADSAGSSLEQTLQTTPGGADALSRMREYADNLILVRASGAYTTLERIWEVTEEYVTPARRTVVFVDYLQKVPLQPEPEVESEKVTRAVEGLKDLALTLHVPVVVLSAVDRHGMEASRIRLHHLRGSSAVAFEADVVLMLNDKHKAVSKVHLSYDARAARTFREWVVFTVEKNRGGPNLIDLEFRKDFAHFRFHPEGGIVSERLVDERFDEHEL